MPSSQSGPVLEGSELCSFLSVDGEREGLTATFSDPSQKHLIFSVSCKDHIQGFGPETKNHNALPC